MDVSKSNFPARCVDVAIGILLIATALLKAANPDQTLSFLDYSSSSIRFIAIQTEIVLGTWLILGMARRTAWTMALILFAIMAVASLWLAIQGQSDCGCFGSIHVSPWLTFAIDMVSIALLILTRPKRLHWQNALLPISLCAILILSGVGLSTWTDSSAGRRTIAKFQGHDILLEASQIDIGSGRPDETKTVEITLHNLANHDIKIVGGKASCSCVATKGLPMTVKANGTAHIPIEVTYLSDPGLFKREFTLLIDRATTSQLHGELIGVVAP